MEIKYSQLQYIQNQPEVIYELQIDDNYQKYVRLRRAQIHNVEYYQGHQIIGLGYRYEDCGCFSEEKMENIMLGRDEKYFVSEQEANNFYEKNKAVYTKTLKEKTIQQANQYIEYHKRNIAEMEERIRKAKEE